MRNHMISVSDWSFAWLICYTQSSSGQHQAAHGWCVFGHPEVSAWPQVYAAHVQRFMSHLGVCPCRPLSPSECFRFLFLLNIWCGQPLGGFRSWPYCSGPHADLVAPVALAPFDSSPTVAGSQAPHLERWQPFQWPKPNCQRVTDRRAWQHLGSSAQGFPRAPGSCWRVLSTPGSERERFVLLSVLAPLPR